MSIPIYAGPGKVFINSVGLQAEGENGPIHVAYNHETAAIAAAMFGRIGEQTLDKTVEITTKPFDHWGLLATLFPARLAVTTGAGAGVLAVGGRPHGATNLPTVVWRPDGISYTVHRTAVIGHPTLHLGVGKGLYDSIRIIGLGDPAKNMGDADYLMAVAESGAPDPGGAMTMADFVREAWTGVWGNTAGFGGAASALGSTDAIQAEDEWTISNEIRYSMLKVQGRTVAAKLDSAAFMARVRPFGPAHTDLLAAVEAQAHGQRLGSADLTLTSGITGKTITLKNAEVKGAGFELGGTGLGSGEIGFVNEMTFSGGAPQPLIIFSA